MTIPKSDRDRIIDNLTLKLNQAAKTNTIQAKMIDLLQEDCERLRRELDDANGVVR